MFDDANRSDLLGDLGPTEDQDALISGRRYRRTLITAVVSVSVVAVVPLLIMAGVADHQYREAFRAEATRPMVRIAANGKQSLEAFLSARLSALALVIRERPFEELRNSRQLGIVLANLKQAFGGFVDLGVIGEDGVQISYAGPFELQGRSYAEYPWFHEVNLRGTYVSEVYMGYRNMPHFVIAVREDLRTGGAFVLRASIDTDVINRLVNSLVAQPSWDALIVNRRGVLQTPSHSYGDVLDVAPFSLPQQRDQGGLMEIQDATGERLVVSVAPVDRSPFTLVILSAESGLHAGLLPLRRDLVLFLIISVVLILAVVIGGSSYMVNRARDADTKRAFFYHQMEYTNKMAALGRLSAGVAHEINNPLSIITEKAGLLKDLLTVSEELPPRNKLLDLINSVLNSAERCGGITHRLLGFAKHMEVQRETIEIGSLIEDVLAFLEKEASYRSIAVKVDIPEDMPTIVSDRGQLQQVFLNIVNNAFAAVDDGGQIHVGVTEVEPESVSISIADNGSGIKEEHLNHIFDPFFTTKKGAGTGLGLSITYGIVQKLGGTISVKSTVGEGTCFTVTLPQGQGIT